ncbi:hypothetical protein [Streptomyces chattanoogensis]|uniref:hypothetical protein n=1 Tax=Streptomyces chattanoogensis TaxID=66876 RepID=UPI000B14180C|nr:hypothetical protein [Streptomyces chattanoogensis]
MEYAGPDAEGRFERAGHRSTRRDGISHPKVGRNQEPGSRRTVTTGAREGIPPRQTRDIDPHRVGKGAADDTEGERLLAS